MDTTRDYALRRVRNNISKDDIIRWAKDYYWDSFYEYYKDDLKQLVDDTNEEARDNVEEWEEVKEYDEWEVEDLLAEWLEEALENEIDCAW